MSDHKTDILIAAKGISQEYPTGTQTVLVLKDVSFEVPNGSFTIIHGPSGSGKTTLLNTITGLDNPTAGEVLYEGRNIYGLSPEQLAHFRGQNMGIVYQSNYWVKSLSVLENVALPLYFLGYDQDRAEKKALESLKQVGMDVHASKLPSVLSGGEQQRVSMARALVCNPSYIVADEPTGNLDSQNGDAIMELLKHFNELGRTIILITHNLEYLPLGSQIIEVKDGMVTEKKQEAKAMHGAAKRAHQAPAQTDADEKPGHNSIRPKIVIHMALKNLRFKRLRSTLTALGVIIGVGSVFMLLSFGLGLQSLVQEEIIGAQSVTTIDVSSPNTEVIKLDETAIDRTQNIANVTRIGRLNTSAGDVLFRNAHTDAVVYGVDQSYLELGNNAVIAGRQLNTQNIHEAIINKSMLQTLNISDPKQAVDSEVLLTLKLDAGDKKLDQPFKIVGVFDSGAGAAIYIPNANYELAGKGDFSQLKVAADNAEDIPGIRQQVEGFGFETVSPLDTIEQVNRFFRFLNVILVMFGGIGMVIAVLGMINTMTISLLERTKEIGLMIALGGRRQDVKRLFVTESLLLSFIGAIVGIIGATLLGFAVDGLLNRFAASRGVAETFSLFSTPLWLIVATVITMLVIGYLVSYLPARRAARINPIDALRNE